MYLFLTLALFIFGCEGDDPVKGAPNCINSKISEISDGDVWNPPAKIYSFQYNKKTVYFFPQRCCDIPSEVYNEQCELICSPDGGFSGKGDGKCSDFWSEATDQLLIWEDTRK
jgi:hypothetical protein